MKTKTIFNRCKNNNHDPITPLLRSWRAVLVLFLLLLASCVETLDIDADGVKPKIVLNGIIEADSAISITISKTYPFTNNYYDNEWYRKKTGKKENPPNFLPHARPLLYVNDELKGALHFVKNDTSMSDNGSVFRSGFRPKVGDKIRIEVSNAGFESVWAETVIPQPIQINQVDTFTFYKSTERRAGNDFYVPEDARPLNLALEINIENPDKKNDGFYTFEIYQEWLENKGTSYEFLYRRSLDINKEKELLFSNKVEDELLRFFLEQGNAQTVYYFSEKSFTNKKYKINISVWGYYCHRQYESEHYYKPELHDDPLNIEITSLSPELYQLFYTDYSEMDFYIQLLSEPKVTISNVHNGAGILGSLSKTKRVIEIPQYKGEY